MVFCKTPKSHRRPPTRSDDACRLAQVAGFSKVLHRASEGEGCWVRSWPSASRSSSQLTMMLLPPGGSSSSSCCCYAALCCSSACNLQSRTGSRCSRRKGCSSSLSHTRRTAMSRSVRSSAPPVRPSAIAFIRTFVRSFLPKGSEQQGGEPKAEGRAKVGLGTQRTAEGGGIRTPKKIM